MFDFAGEQEVDYLHQGDLDGVCVLEDWHIDRWLDLERFCFGDGDVVFVPAFMEVAETVTGQRGRSALDAVYLDVLAAGNVWAVRHLTTLSPLDLLESEIYVGELVQIFEFKAVTTKILRSLKLVLAYLFNAVTSSFMAQRGLLSQWKFWLLAS
jgi:hypothetical protein